ncbi:MAG: flagellar biosynthetic protein FliO [Lachnospiraceae bacterium]|nr:flagellar biosynthetic protein FliO [Lachnospiraceae bacterium]
MFLLSIGNTTDNYLRLIGTLFVFVVVLVVAYYVTRWIGQKEQGRFGEKNIRIIEGYRMGTNKSVQIVKVGNKYFVLGVGKDEISYLGEVNEEELVFPENTIKPLPEFKDILAKAKEKIPTKNKRE